MRRLLGPIVLISLGLILIVLFFLFGQAPAAPSARGTPPTQDSQALGAVTPDSSTNDNPTPAGTRAPQPVFPSPTAVPANVDTSAEGSPPSAPAASPTPDPRRCPLADCRTRAGVSGRLGDISAASSAGLPFGNYLDWWLAADGPPMAGRPGADQPRYWQMVPVNQEGPGVSWSKIEQVVAARPGAFWIVGNEPDVTWQDNTTAEAYAAIYHDVYHFIKERDPSARIAAAGVAQPTPLRLAYLEQVLNTYQDLYAEPMPVDIWTVHAFILREQAGSWGVGIPPGMDANEGLLYEIADHDDLTIFQQSLVLFRQWMSANGYAGAPLAVTEFGILHPADYGFPPETVVEFMIGASEFMSSATGDLGDPDDGNRLVQYWFWYSVYDDNDFPTGNLYDARQGSLTAVGRAYSHYLAGR